MKAKDLTVDIAVEGLRGIPAGHPVLAKGTTVLQGFQAAQSSLSVDGDKSRLVLPAFEVLLSNNALSSLQDLTEQLLNGESNADRSRLQPRRWLISRESPLLQMGLVPPCQASNGTRFTGRSGVKRPSGSRCGLLPGFRLLVLYILAIVRGSLLLIHNTPIQPTCFSG